jgi:hypothetical protein
MKVVVWGAGRKGRSVAGKLRKNQLKYFVDTNSEKIGKYINGVEVRPIESLYKENPETVLVTTVQDDTVKRIVSKWKGKIFDVNDFFMQPEIIKQMDEDIYTQYLYDIEIRDAVFTEKTENWYRETFFDDKNQKFLEGMKKDDRKAVNNFLEGAYSNKKPLFDEIYDSRPGMRLARQIVNNMEKENRILDFACGHGQLIKKLAQDGYDAWGFDYSENRVASLIEGG